MKNHEKSQDRLLEF